MKKKKPEGKDFEAFLEKWYARDHEGKVALAEEFGVTYETIRHWVSDVGAARKPVKKSQIDINEQAEAVREVLAMKPKVKLLFSSFDIETTGLKADFSIVLSAVIKPYGGKPIIFRADDYPEWAEGRRADDKVICRDITNELAQHAVVVTHYGTGYDIRYTRAKLIRYGLPPLPPMFSLDTYNLAKANMLVSRRRLDALSEYLRLGHKSVVNGNLWMEAAMDGRREAMDAIVKHNVQDCVLLEQLASLLFPYMRSMRKL